MKRFILFASIPLLCFACKTEVKTTTTYEDDQELKNNQPIVKEPVEKIPTTAEAIAYANGFKKWDKVTEIKFTFNVDRDSSHYERSWVWKPKQNEITRTTSEDTITYNRDKITAMSLKADQGFINDKYWLLAPFNLIWDQDSYTSELQVKAKAPISGKEMQKLTIIYKNEGGYTPGDAYDFFFEGDFIIKEWVFREKNTREPSLITTWEDYTDYNGIKISKTHKRDDNNWTLYFTGVEVTTE